MYDYLDKNFNHFNWFYQFYHEEKLKNLQGSIQFMKQIAYDFDSDTYSYELVNGTANFSFEFNRQKEIIREISAQETFETKYRSFKESKISSKEYLKDNTIDLYEYDESTDLVSKCIKINKEGIRTEKELKTEKLTDGSVIHYGENFDFHYDSYDRIISQKANYSDLEFLYDYSTNVKKGYYTKTSRSGGQINSEERYSQEDYILESTLYRDNLLSSKRMFFYDETNRLIQLLIFFDDSSFENHYYIYNDQNLLIEDKISYPSGKIGTCDFFEYDLHNNVINSRDRSYQYKYDENGNWIEKIELSRDKILSKITREFVYYPKGMHIV